MIRRLEEIIWILDYLDDLDADFLRFYGIGNMYEMESVRFFRLARRVSAYGGVMAIRAANEQEQENREYTGPEGARMVPLESMSEFIE